MSCQEGDFWRPAEPQLACRQKEEGNTGLTRRQITLDSLLTNFTSSVGQVPEGTDVLQLCRPG